MAYELIMLQPLEVLERVCEGVKKYSLFFTAFYHSEFYYGFVAMDNQVTETNN